MVTAVLQNYQQAKVGNLGSSLLKYLFHMTIFKIIYYLYIFE